MDAEITFSYKTRGDSSPNGKPKVFFTCHPADFEKHFDKICDDLFKAQTCAVCYTEDMNAELTGGNSLADLGRMNLFVIPVTRRLLEEGCRAVDSDLPFALAQHIPVLPIMLEPGLDAAYSRPDRFGKLQYLSPYGGDATEIGYEEKLKKYLGSVLIGGELAERIRKAFDAYIFLSYRKKDRAYANELMRLIHGQPGFRDIAIWFDEFLTPGESFQENILRVLENSELFALLVTPNLLEKPNGKPNYVMGEEYPAAVRLGKPVFAAEMERTDRRSLSEEFKNIPSPVDVRTDAAFRERLLAALNKAALCENSSDPEHSFLIGLAYLDGIDVEVNAQRGADLITGAAKKNYLPAVRQLVSMYSAGCGVEMNIGEAEAWQQKAVDLLEDIAEETRTEADALELLREGYALGELALSIEDFETAKKAYTGAFHTAKRLCFGAVGKNAFVRLKVLFKKYVRNESFYNEASVYLIRACRRLLDLAFSFGSAGEITEWARRSLVLVQAVDAQLASSETAVELLSLCGRMAEECAASGNIAGGRNWLELGCDCWKGLDDEQKTREVKLAYARFCGGKSAFCFAQAKRNDAYDAQDERLDLLHELYRETPDDYSLRYGMIDCLLKQAAICFDARAADTLGELLDRAKKLIAYEMKNDNYLVKLLHAECLLNEGRLAYLGKDYRAAAELAEKSFSVLRPIAEIKFDAAHQRQLEEAAELAGNAYAALGLDPQAIGCYEKARGVLAGLTSVSDQVRDIRSLARVYEKLLDASIRTARSTSIISYNEKALWTRKALTEGVKTGGFGSKAAARAIADGNDDFAAFRDDLRALEKLQSRQEEILRSAAECSQKEARLIDELRPAKTDCGALFKGIAEIARSFVETHTVPEIRQDLSCLADSLTKAGGGDLLNSPGVSQAQLIRSAKRICGYIAARYEPFFKFDEDCMLILAFCAELYCMLSSIALPGKGKTDSVGGPKFSEIVFLEYPVSEIARGELWQQLYSWINEAG